MYTWKLQALKLQLKGITTFLRYFIYSHSAPILLNTSVYDQKSKYIAAYSGVR